MAAILNGSATYGLASFSKGLVLSKTEFGRPSPGANDVELEVKFCGMCHSDLHTVLGEWGEKPYPFTPGHEATGIVRSVGSDVTKHKVGDRVGVGCFVDSCGGCDLCEKGMEQHCPASVMTYGSTFPKGHSRFNDSEITRGGYSDKLVVSERFVFNIPDALSLEHASVLLCAGITTFSPLARHVLGKNCKSVAVLGLGGLGHLSVKIAQAMGAKVTILSRSRAKQAEANALGCDIIVQSDAEALNAASKTFDVVIDTASAHHDISSVMKTLKVGGTHVLLGGVSETYEINAFQLFSNRQRVEGSLVGGCEETEDMLAFCAKHNILPDIDVIEAKDATAAFKALAEGAVAKRHVIDMSTLASMG